MGLPRLATALAALAALAAGAELPPPELMLPGFNESIMIGDMLMGPAAWGAAGCAAGGVGELKLECALPAGRLTLATDRAATYITLQCEADESGSGRFSCEELQQHAGETLRQYTQEALQQHSGEARVLRSLAVERCRLEEPLRCLAALAGAGDVAALVLRAVPTPLAPAHLQGLRAITHLRMLNMGPNVTAVPYAVLGALPALARLDASGGALRLAAPWEPALPALAMLELAEDALAALPPRAFDGLPHLRNLSLWGNRIDTVHEDAFLGLSSLERLSLNSNRVRRLPARALRATPRLRLLHAYGNRLEALPPLQHLQHLEEIWVNNKNATELRLDNDTFAGLEALRSLKIEACGVRALAGGVLRGARALRALSLRANLLERLPEELLADQPALEALDLANNGLRELPRGLLARQGALARLDLSRNRLAALPARAFLGLAALRKLDLSRNLFAVLHASAFEGLGGLRELSLSYNALTMEAGEGAGERQSPLGALKALARLELAHNAVPHLMDDWRDMPQLRDLDLSYNNITELLEEDLQLLGVATVDVRHNRVARVRDLTWARDEGLQSSRATFLLADNPFRCDCYMYHFLADRPRPDHRRRFEMAGARCAEPAALRGAELDKVEAAALRCALPAPACPAGCACALHPASGALELACERAPAACPAPAAYGLEWARLRVRAAPADVAALPAAVARLDVSGLGLRAPPAASAPRPGLTVDLSGNNLTAAPLALLDANCTVLLGGNPLACDCAHRESLSRLRARWELVADGDAVRCAGGGAGGGAGGAGGAADGAGGGAVSALAVGRLCAARDALALAALLASAAGLAVAAALMLAFRYRTEARLLLRRCAWLDCLFPEKDGGDDKKYDAFVSFSHEDEAWVRAALVPRLEGGRRALRLCVHYRDWEVGGLIPEQIERSVRASRRTVVVLSEGFVRSVWGRLEFRAAHALERAIVLVLGGGALALARGDRELRAYLATNTYVEASDPLVWDRIKDAVLRARRPAPAAAPAAAAAAPPERKLKAGALDVQLVGGRLVNAAAR